MRQRVRFASSLAAALLDGLSEQHVQYFLDVRDVRQSSISKLVLGFVNTVLDSTSVLDAYLGVVAAPQATSQSA